MENGRCFEGGILKVDSFINHQMDPDLMKIIGKEFAELYRDSGVNKILTIEASGIAPAIMAGAYMHLPPRGQFHLSVRKQTALGYDSIIHKIP